MKIGIVSDHRGYDIKAKIIKYLSNKDHIIKDYGTNNLSPTDYPKYAFILGEKVYKKEVEMGIAICGSGIGMSIACNKVKGVRCAHIENINDAKWARLDNNANVIALSSKIPFHKMKKIIDTFINTDFSDEKRHIKRIQMISDYESDDEK